MANLAAPGGTLLDTTVRTVIENPAGSGEVRGYDVAFINTDGQVSASLTACRVVYADAAKGVRAFLPLNYPVRALDMAARRLVLGPGDKLEASASAPGDITAHVQQYYAEKTA